MRHMNDMVFQNVVLYILFAAMMEMVQNHTSDVSCILYVFKKAIFYWIQINGRNMYEVQQDTLSFLMIEFIYHIC